jgi:hypothetical protein
MNIANKLKGDLDALNPIKRISNMLNPKKARIEKEIEEERKARERPLSAGEFRDTWQGQYPVQHKPNVVNMGPSYYDKMKRKRKLRINQYKADLEGLSVAGNNCINQYRLKTRMPDDEFITKMFTVVQFEFPLCQIEVLTYLKQHWKVMRALGIKKVTKDDIITFYTVYHAAFAGKFSNIEVEA